MAILRKQLRNAYSVIDAYWFIMSGGKLYEVTKDEV